METARELQAMRARAEKAEQLAAQLSQQLTDERARCASQKHQLEQLEQQVEALLKRLYRDVLTEDSANNPASKRASLLVETTQSTTCVVETPRTRSKSDRGIIKEVSKKTTTFLRRLSDALPGSGSRNKDSSPASSVASTPRSGSQPSRPATNGSQISGGSGIVLVRSRSSPSSIANVAENTTRKRDVAELPMSARLSRDSKDKDRVREKDKDRAREKDKKEKERVVVAMPEPPKKQSPVPAIPLAGTSTLRGVPGEITAYNGHSMRRMRSMHVASLGLPQTLIRRTRSEEQLSSWECMETTMIARKSSSRMIVSNPTPLRLSTVGSALEQEYRTSGSNHALSPKKDQTDFTWSPTGGIRAASIMRLVDYVVLHNSDPELVRTLIISFRLYEKPVWLLANLSFSFSRTTSDSVRRRIIFIIRRWLECAPCDFAEPIMRSTLSRFLERDVHKRAGMESHAAGLMRLISDHESSSSSLECSHSSASSHSSDLEIANSYTYLDTPIAKLELIGIDPCVLAEQLTLMDSAFFRSISVTHWLANCKSGSWQNTPVATLVQRFNNVSAFLAFEIVTTFHLKKRTAMLKHLILAARRLCELNNFHGLMAVLSALSNAAVGRLKRTWKALPSNVRSMHAQLEDVTDPKANFQAYRQTIKRVASPAIPYLAVCMRDLTVIHEANQTMAAKTLMNVEKCEMLARIIGEFEVCKTASYTMLQAIPALQRFIETFAHSLDANVINEQTTHAFSLRCEQRAVEL